MRVDHERRHPVVLEPPDDVVHIDGAVVVREVGEPVCTLRYLCCSNGEIIVRVGCILDELLRSAVVTVWPVQAVNFAESTSAAA